MRYFFIFFSSLYLTFTGFTQQNDCKNFSLLQGNSNNIKKRSVSDTRLKDYDVTFYNLDLNVSNLNTNISGFVESKVIVKKANFNTLVFDLAAGFTIDSIVVNGAKKTSQQTGDLLLINLNVSYQVDDILSTKIYYKGKGGVGSYFPVGMLNGKNSKSKYYTYTASEPFNSMYWWPCKQDLEDKADSVYINITTENTNTVASNGLLKSTKSVGNKKRFEWKTYYPIQYYLIAFSCGPYYVKNTYAKPAGIKDSILIQDFLYTSADATTYATEIGITKKLIEAYSEKLGVYPFYKEKYGHFMVPSKFGALENQTITMIGDYYSTELVSHELSHQWFGNNNTCEKWNEIWLHEGFAEYFGQILVNELLTNQKYSAPLSGMIDEVINSTQTSTYLSDSDAKDPFKIFDHASIYTKGAVVLSMLRFELGDSLFFEVLKTFYEKNKGGLMSTSSLNQIVNEKSGNNYTDFFNQWIYGNGYPTFDFVFKQMGDTLYIESNQTSNSTVSSVFKMKLDFLIKNNDSNDTLIFNQIVSNEIFKVYYPGKIVTSITPNPSSWNLLKVNSTKFLSNDNKLYSFFIKDPYVLFTNNENKDTVVLNIPFTPNINNLIAGFTVGSGATVKIGNVTQVSGTTKNDFSKKITYTVFAQDGSSKNYIVIVYMTPASSEKILSKFNITNALSIDTTGNLIDVVMPFGVKLNSLKPTFRVSNFAKVYIGNVEQFSDVTSNDYSKTVVYTVIAQDGTTANYTVNVSNFPGSNEKKLIDFSVARISALNELYNGVIEGDSITISVPYGFKVDSLVSFYTVSKDATVKIGNVFQTSSLSINDFTNPIFYTVFAQDGSSKSYLVTIHVQPDTSQTTNLESINGLSSFFCYPNPSKGELFLKGNSEIIYYSIFDLYGNEILHSENEKLQTTDLKLNLPQVPSGLYFVIIKTKNFEFIEKLRVQY